MNKGKIVIVTGVFYPEPVVSAGLMKDLATELAKDYEVTVLRPRPSRPMGFQIPAYSYEQFPFEVIETDSYVYPASSIVGRFRESYSMGRWCAKYIEQHHEDICFVYNGPWHMIGRNIVAKAAMKHDIPYMTPVQDVYPESLSSKLPDVLCLRKVVNKLLLPSDKSLLSHAARVHTISEKMVDYLSRTRCLSKENFVVVRNWQDERPFVDYANQKGEQECADNPFTFMYMGNVGPLAGIDVLFDALKEARIDNARLVIAGSGSAKQHLMEKAKTYKDCLIEFWDVPAGKVPETQSKADVMVLPVKKGFAMSSIPSKLPAYMFSKKPVLASVDKESDTAMCIINSHAGWVAEPENVNSIAKSMRIAYETRVDDLLHMGDNGYNFAIENLSRTKNLKKLVKACREIIEK